jgi:hypothetical protein
MYQGVWHMFQGACRVFHAPMCTYMYSSNVLSFNYVHVLMKHGHAHIIYGGHAIHWYPNKLDVLMK